MNIKEFVSQFKNHPVLFIGTGFSLRYLKNSYTWDGLLQEVCESLKGNSEYYLDVKSRNERNGKYDFPRIATDIEEEFNRSLSNDRDGPFKEINDIFYEEMSNGNNLSRFKIYISRIFQELQFKEENSDELKALKQARKNIASVITTNYDQLIEEIFEFSPLIGNSILLSNPYGSVYKIHGCTTCPKRIIIGNEDYEQFSEKHELIRAQLLSIFIHNPIIFIGYGVGDENIKSLLKTIFTYVTPNSEEAELIRKNFLLVEYSSGSDSLDIVEHDIDLEGFSTIRINKIKTDNYLAIYESISELQLAISAMDIRKVQNIVKEIYSGGDIKVNITEDLDSLDNREKIIAIGSNKTISYQFQSTSDMMANYFNIIEESNSQLLLLIDKQRIQSGQYFPAFAFSKIQPKLQKIDHLTCNQVTKLELAIQNTPAPAKNNHSSIIEINADESITASNKLAAIVWGLWHDRVQLSEVEAYLKSFKEKRDSPYRKLLCAYDYKKFGSVDSRCP